LELRAEQQRPIAHTVVQGLLTETISGQVQLATLAVPERKREHAHATFQGRPYAPGLDTGKQHFGVRVADEAMAARDELRTQLAIVVHLAVVHDRIAAARGAHRLM